MASYLVISRVRQFVTLDESEFAGNEGAVKAAEANITVGTDSEIGDSSEVTGYTISSWVASAQSWANSVGDVSSKAGGALPAGSGQ